jgi:hypothetical protein
MLPNESLEYRRHCLVNHFLSCQRFYSLESDLPIENFFSANNLVIGTFRDMLNRSKTIAALKAFALAEELDYPVTVPLIS